MRTWLTNSLASSSGCQRQMALSTKAVGDCQALTCWKSSGRLVLAARHPAISGAMVLDKLQAVRDAGASVLLSADCGCLLNIHHAAAKLGGMASGQPRCVHLGSFLRERMGAADAAQQVID